MYLSQYLIPQQAMGRGGGGLTFYKILHRYYDMSRVSVSRAIPGGAPLRTAKRRHDARMKTELEPCFQITAGSLLVGLDLGVPEIKIKNRSPKS
jgi:hypothetical protein